MTPELAVEVLRQALIATFWLGAPLLAIGFAAGIVISLIQITTSIQDTAFSTVPRLAAFLVGLLLLMPWMFKRLSMYTISLFGDLGRYAR
ncbi:MAG TPA: flagellar biosynthetic protein FliQ [Candidatus Omnitrophota bacterium]|nr:flagellar biosynthetic protein FliQ [Candidatus Omnitrophota bacterium]